MFDAVKLIRTRTFVPDVAEKLGAVTLVVPSFSESDVKPRLTTPIRLLDLGGREIIGISRLIGVNHAGSRPREAHDLEFSAHPVLEASREIIGVRPADDVAVGV